MGFIVNLLSRPVIYGFMAAAPLIIGFSRLGNLLGLDLERSQYVVHLVADAAEHIQPVNIYALAIGNTGRLVRVVMNRINPLIPRASVRLVAGGLLMWLLPSGDGIPSLRE